MKSKLVAWFCLGIFLIILFFIPESCTRGARGLALEAASPQKDDPIEEAVALSGDTITLDPALAELSTASGNTAFQTLHQDNADLRSAFEFRENLKLTVIICRTTARDIDRWYHTLRINVGSKHGVRTGQVIIDKGCCVIGQVFDLGADNSGVALITSNRCRILASVPHRETTGIVQGDRGTAATAGQPTLLLPPPLPIFGTIRNETTPASRTWVAPGDWVRTTWLNQGAPSGLLIGRITEIALDTQNLPCKALLTPASDLRHLDLLFVVVGSQPGVPTALEAVP